MANMIQAVIGSTGFEYFTIVPFIQQPLEEPGGPGPAECISGVAGYQKSTFGTINGTSSGSKYRNFVIRELRGNYGLEYVDNPPYGECSVTDQSFYFSLEGTGIQNVVDRNFFSRIEFLDANNVVLFRPYYYDFDFSAYTDLVTWTYLQWYDFGSVTNFRIYY
jgi:hypothetical protein